MKDYSRIHWVKWFTPDTAGWLSLSLGARGLMAELVRKVDGGGYLHLSSLDDLAFLLRIPVDELSTKFSELRERGRLQWSEDTCTLFIPGHADRQNSESISTYRVQRWRERNGMKRDETACNGVKRDATPETIRREEKRREEIKDPEREHAGRVPKAEQRGTRVPDSDAEARMWCLEKGIPWDHPERPRFLDHWRSQPGQRGVKRDWAATWRNWARRSEEFKPRMNGLRATGTEGPNYRQYSMEPPDDE